MSILSLFNGWCYTPIIPTNDISGHERVRDSHAEARKIGMDWLIGIGNRLVVSCLTFFGEAVVTGEEVLFQSDANDGRSGRITECLQHLAQALEI